MTEPHSALRLHDLGLFRSEQVLQTRPKPFVLEVATSNNSCECAFRRTFLPVPDKRALMVGSEGVGSTGLFHGDPA